MASDPVARHFFNGFIRLHILYHAAKEPIYGAEIAEELIRHEHAAHAVGMGHACLLGGCQGDAPGARIDLLAEQAGRHGRLAVGRELGAVGVHKALHPGQVVRQARLREHGGRQAQILAQQIPALRCGVLRRAGRRQRTQALVERADHVGHACCACFTHTTPH